MTFSHQVIPPHISPQDGPLPALRAPSPGGKVGKWRVKPWVKLRTHLSLLTFPFPTGPRAVALCSAQAGSSCERLSTSSRSAGLCVAPWTGRPPPVPPVGDTASPGPCHPAHLPPCTVLPPACEPQMGQPLCYLDIGTEEPLASGAAFLSRGGRLPGRRAPRPLGEASLSMLRERLHQTQ